jgi:hypothetical protein
MKNVLIIVVSIFVLTCLTFSQPDRDRMMKNKGKLEQLEKIKLIEALDLNEDTAVRFFARRNDSRKEVGNLEDKIDELMFQLEDSFDLTDKNTESNQKQMLNEILSLRENIEQKRSLFAKSLTDILTTEQICKYIVFEKKFRDEIRDVLLKKNHPK